MINFRKHLKAALITALGYGLGFVIGVIAIDLIFESGLLDSVADLFENQHLTIGILILFVVVMLGGALAGAIGGVGLKFGLSLDDWKRPTSRSAVGFGFGFGIVLMPILVIIASLSMYNVGDSSAVGFVISMGVVGLIFGFVSGVMTATLPQRGNYWRVTGILSVAFGVGGLAFGFGLWQYFFALFETGVGTAELIFSFFIFGAVGGLVMGWSFSRELEKMEKTGDDDILHVNVFYRAGQWFKETKFYQKRGFWGTIIFIGLIFLLSRLLAMSPLNFSEASLAEKLPLDSIGVHWSEPWILNREGGEIHQPSIAELDGTVAVVWVQDDLVLYTLSAQIDGKEQIWQTPSQVSESKGSEPQIALDSTGRVHIVWTGTSSQDRDTDVFYRTCLDGVCSEITTLSGSESATCSEDQNTNPSIVINGQDKATVVWENGTDNLAATQWLVASEIPGEPYCALVDWQGAASNPRLGTLPDGEPVLVFEYNGEIFVSSPQGNAGFEVLYKEAGSSPEVFVDKNGTAHIAWCGPDSQVNYRGEGGLSKTIPTPGCINRPVLGQDAGGTMHLLWYASEAEQPSGRTVESDLIYGSRLVSTVWTDPIIVNLSNPGSQPEVATGKDGMIHLVWDFKPADVGEIHYGNFDIYECDEANLNSQGQMILDIARSGDFRPEDDLVPYCHNQFDSLLILPEYDLAYSDNPPTLNGAFDDVSALIRDARYEVLFSTMWYETDDTGTSPGVVLAEGVKALYDQVKAQPERYPRGMTVRILLGNPPEFTLSNVISQGWNVFNHMRFAGVPTMSDPEIGWKLEVANYGGSWPHGHTKMVVIDGKTAVAAGFNYQHKHQSKDHPSGKGKDDFDLGLQMTGPVAQTTRISFDDLWSGSNSILCPDLDSESPLWWISCRRSVATDDHVPEVMKLFLAPKNNNAFALHRTDKFQESDISLPEAVATAQETMDVLQVNFTLKLICDLNLLFEVCDFRDALVYMEAMMEAIETNNVKTRVLIKPGPIEAVESNIAVDAFRDALEAKGLSDLVEFRYFQDSVHAKAVLIDDQFLFVGSQNFHYSAFGDGALTEFNFGTDDPAAISEFKRFFEYHWERAEPIPVKE